MAVLKIEVTGIVTPAEDRAFSAKMLLAYPDSELTFVPLTTNAALVEGNDIQDVLVLIKVVMDTKRTMPAINAITQAASRSFRKRKIVIYPVISE